MIEKDWLSIKEAADCLGVKQDALRKRVKRGTYRHRYVKGKGSQKEIRIFKDDIMRTVEEEARAKERLKRKEKFESKLEETGRAKRAKPKVLLADDSENFTKYLSKLLGDWDILIARDGEEALKMLEDDFPDLLLLEIPIPKINGYEVIERKNQNELIAGIPFALVSYLKGSLRVEEGRTYKPQGYFRKPLLGSELEEFKGFITQMKEKIVSQSQPKENIQVASRHGKQATDRH